MDRMDKMDGCRWARGEPVGRWLLLAGNGGVPCDRIRGEVGGKP